MSRPLSPLVASDGSTLWDLTDSRYDPPRSPDPIRLEWDRARSDLLGRDGPRGMDPLSEERDSGR